MGHLLYLNVLAWPSSCFCCVLYSAYLFWIKRSFGLSLLKLFYTIDWCYHLLGHFQGLKKPYNPILGETFRCFWLHPNGTKTHFVAEQVSHHPPVSAFYVSNRKEGYVVNCSCLAKSKFYGKLLVLQLF